MRKTFPYLLIFLSFSCFECSGSDKKNSDINDFQKTDYSKTVTTAFEEFYETKKTTDKIELLLGCGQKHTKLTVANNPHNHEGAFTIDKCEGKLNRYGVTNPHVRGDILNPTLLQSMPGEIFDHIIVEHINLCLLGSRYTRGQVLQEVFRMLKPGGGLTFLTGGVDHLYIDLEEIKQCFWELGFYLEEVSFFKKVPKVGAKTFMTLSQEKRMELLDEVLLSNDRKYWKKVSTEEQSLYSNPIFGHYGYYQIIAWRPQAENKSENLLDEGSDGSLTETEEASDNDEMNGFMEEA